MQIAKAAEALQFIDDALTAFQNNAKRKTGNPLRSGLAYSDCKVSLSGNYLRIDVPQTDRYVPILKAIPPALKPFIARYIELHELREAPGKRGEMLMLLADADDRQARIQTQSTT